MERLLLANAAGTVAWLHTARQVIAGANMPHRALAAQIGVSEATVSRYLSGARTPRGGYAVRWVAVVVEVARATTQLHLVDEHVVGWVDAIKTAEVRSEG